MMDHFFVWELRGVRLLCLRDPINPWYAAVTVKRLPPGK